MGTVGRIRENKLRVQTALCQVMASVLWDSEGILLVEFLKRVATINSEQYVQTLKKVKWIWRVWPNRKMNQVLIASSDSRFSILHFHCFDPLKDGVEGCRFAGDKLNHGICEELRRFSKEFFVSGVQRLSQGWERSVLIMKEVSWKNKPKFCKGCTHGTCKFNYYCSCSSWENERH